jgi:hypothetical protein
MDQNGSAFLYFIQMVITYVKFSIVDKSFMLKFKNMRMVQISCNIHFFVPQWLHSSWKTLAAKLCKVSEPFFQQLVTLLGQGVSLLQGLSLPTLDNIPNGKDKHPVPSVEFKSVATVSKQSAPIP